MLHSHHSSGVETVSYGGSSTTHGQALPPGQGRWGGARAGGVAAGGIAMMADKEEVAAANEGGAEDDDGDGGQLSSM